MITKEKEQLIKRNAEILWNFVTKDPTGIKHFGVADMPKVEKRTVQAAIRAGIPRQIANYLIYYSGSAPGFSFPGFWQEILSPIIFDLSRSYAKKIQNFFVQDMQKFLPRLRIVLDEGSNEDEEELEKFAEAPPGAPLGRIAFSPKRLDKVPNFETNTPREQQLFMALYRHIEQNIKLPKEQTDFIKSLMKKGYYQKLFKPPAMDLVYRGMSVSGQLLRKILKLRPGEKLKSKGTAAVNFLYRPRKGNASSWTKQKKVAKDFSHLLSAGAYEIILVASVDDNPDVFFDLNNGLYKVTPFDLYQNEKEIVAMGKVRILKIEWSEF